MALNIKDPETEQLASEVARMTGESKIGAIRAALKEHRDRLALRGANGDRDAGRVILDASALLAIAFDEPERPTFLQKIRAAATVGLGAPTLVETGVVLAARIGDRANERLARLVERASSQSSRSTTCTRQSQQKRGCATAAAAIRLH